MKPECGNCAYYVDNNSGYRSGFGKCRRFPDHVDTNDGKWCGEHRPAEDHSN